MIVIHIKENATDILYYDSYHSVGTNKVLAIHNYLLHTARRLQLDQYLHWNIKGNEAAVFPAQTDAVSCGVYLIMIANCLITDIDLSILTQDTMLRCRTRIAHALLENSIPGIIVGIPSPTQRSNNPEDQQSGNALGSLLDSSLPPLLRSTYS